MNDDNSFWLQLGADTNGDGRVSLADASTLLLDILMLPGDALVYLLVNYAPGIANFLEVSEGGSPNVVSITASVVIWLAAIILTGTIVGKLRELDRTMTAWIAGRYRELLRLSRILRRRLIAAIVSRNHGEDKDRGLVVDAVQLEKLETAVLRCLSTIDDGAVLTTEEIAGKLNRPNRELTIAIARLIELEFIKPDTDRFAKRDGHRIATAGQMYLLGA